MIAPRRDGSRNPKWPLDGMRASRLGARLLFAFHVLQPLSLLIALRIGIAPGLIAALAVVRVDGGSCSCGCCWVSAGCAAWACRASPFLLAAIAGADAPAPMQAADNAEKAIWANHF